jgi:molybdopterin converting factor small subunit
MLATRSPISGGFMTVTALLFASYADLLGTSSVSLTLPAGATVHDAVERLRELPGGDSLPSSPLVAVNLNFARPDATLTSGDELALIPPVAGG